MRGSNKTGRGCKTDFPDNVVFQQTFENVNGRCSSNFGGRLDYNLGSMA